MEMRRDAIRTDPTILLQNLSCRLVDLWKVLFVPGDVGGVPTRWHNLAFSRHTAHFDVRTMMTSKARGTLLEKK